MIEVETEAWLKASDTAKNGGSELWSSERIMIDTGVVTKWKKKPKN